jgi:hypothetical protein
MPLKKETEQSAHEAAFDCLISRISDDDSILCSLMSRLKLFFLHMKHKLLSMEPDWTTDRVWMTAESGIDPISCQRPSLENLICMRSISKNSLIEATCMNVRRDNIFEMITGELSSYTTIYIWLNKMSNNRNQHPKTREKIHHLYLVKMLKATYLRTNTIWLMKQRQPE